MAATARLNAGIWNPRAKLSEGEVREIRSLKGVVSQRQLAKQFGVSKTAVKFCQQGITWKCLGGQK